MGESGGSGRHVHVVGTGTIGEPLIGLLCTYRQELGINTVSFNKKQALTIDRPKVKALIRRGAVLCATQEMIPKFRELGQDAKLVFPDVLGGARAVIDCTPAGNANKALYQQYEAGVNLFAAQGSEFGFGTMYARGINEDVLRDVCDKYRQIPSCNTHNLAVLIDTLALQQKDPTNLVEGRFVLIRRASDISQDGSYVPAPQAGKHDDPKFGTHHARDAYHLFKTLGYDLPLFSSTMKVNTQFMHSMWFSIRLREKITLGQVIARLQANPRVALTEKRSGNTIFSFGRDQGHFGRLLSQTVVSVPTLAVVGDHEVVGFTFTPQDGNSLLSSVAAAVWALHPEDYLERLKALDGYIFQEI